MSTARKLRVEDAQASAAAIEPLPLAGVPGSELASTLSRRRSAREFARRRLELAELGALLWAGQGITAADGNRTAPSAGALHPVALTLVDASGIARYLPDRHALEHVAAGDRRPPLAAAAYAQECVGSAAAIVAITARPGVLQARYGRRSERYCALEAGHVAQNVLLMAAALELAAVPVGAFDDAAVLRALDLGSDHLPLYLVAIGGPAASDSTAVH